MLDMEMIRGSKPSCPILVYPTLAIHSFLEFFPLHSLLVKDCCFMLLASFCLYVKPFAVGNSKSRSPFIRCTRFGLLLLLVLYWFTRAGGIGQGRYSGDLVSFFCPRCSFLSSQRSVTGSQSFHACSVCSVRLGLH